MTDAPKKRWRDEGWHPFSGVIVMTRITKDDLIAWKALMHSPGLKREV